MGDLFLDSWLILVGDGFVNSMSDAFSLKVIISWMYLIIRTRMTTISNWRVKPNIYKDL